jgi:hypothetical protein
LLPKKFQVSTLIPLATYIKVKAFKWYTEEKKAKREGREIAIIAVSGEGLGQVQRKEMPSLLTILFAV